jgi:putative ABC transport system permease protein
MIDTALRSMAQRKLRTALTAIAILLGVAMIAGTYVQTDQIRTAFDEITETSYLGVDVTISPRQEFSGTFAPTEPLSERLVAEAATVPGVDKVEGQLFDSGSLVVDGKILEPTFAPTIVSSVSHPPFDVMNVQSGRRPQRRGEVVVDETVFREQHLRLGQQVGVTTRTGQKRARVVGAIRFGDVSSVGGATFVGASLDDVQRWFDRQGRVTEIVISADQGVSPSELKRRLQRAMPFGVDIRTARQTIDDTSDDIDDAMGFLRPALLAFAGAALLVGAFIIFNTFSITVAERTREFAMLRALGATRGQVLRSVAVEALVLGVVASALGLVAGLGFALTLGALFDAAGFGIPTGDMQLAPRTILIALIVGIGVTLIAALVPAVRATRVPPVAAMQQEGAAPAPRRPRLRAAAATLVVLAGLALLLQGIFGGGAATARLGAMGTGTLLVFVGVAMSSRYIIGPLASLTGWPLRRLGDVTGELARENATRNPGRTAVTAAALMVGLGLVVFVSVFAAGLKDSLEGSLDDRLRADYIITNQNASAPLPAQAKRPIEETAGPGSATAQYLDQVEVNGKNVNAVTDALNGMDPGTLLSVYSFEWLEGSDDAVASLAGPNALIEEQFSKQHGIEVGDRFRLTGPTGRSALFTAVAEYRDPQLLQGVVVNPAQFQRLSAATDPWAFIVKADGGEEVQDQLSDALTAFPTAKVRTVAEYRDLIVGQLDQVIYLLYALLAMSLVISLFGIANSLFLSIHERTRELGMLRAIGATARQVRQLIRYESVITAVIGGLLGTVIGVLFGWLTTFALEDLGLGFSVPYLQLVMFLLLAIVVGIIGSIAPARRAAKLDILRAVGAGE